MLAACLLVPAQGQQPARPAVVTPEPQTATLPAADRYADRQKGVRAMADGIFSAAARFFLDYRSATAGREPDLADATVLLVKAYLLQNQVAEAETALNYQQKHSQGGADPYYSDALVYWRGAVQLAQGHFEQATVTVTPLLEPLRTQEFRRQALELLADAYAKLGRWQQAQSVLKQLLAEFPKSTNVVRAKLALVKAYLSEGQTHLAEESLDLLEQDSMMPTREVLELYRVMIFLNKKELDKATDLYRKIDGLRPSKPNEDWWMAASQLVDQLIPAGRHQDALTILPQVAKLATTDKTRIQAELQQAECLMELGNIQAAVDVVERFRTEHSGALEAVPVQLRLAELLRQQGQAAVAAGYLEEIAKNQAVSQELRYRAGFARGWCYADVGAHAEAMNAFAAAAALGQTEPQQAEAMLLAGDAAFRMQNYAKAATYYQAVAEKYKETPFAENGRFRQAQTRARSKLYGPAAEAFQAFIEEFPQSARLTEARLERGIALRLSGQNELAMQELEQLADTRAADPLAPRALLEGHQAAVAAGQSDRAIALLSKLLENHPDSDLFAQALYQRASSLFLADRNEAAVADARRLVESFPLLPLSADALMWLGDHYANIGEAAHSESAFLRLVTSQPKSHLAPAALYEAAMSAYHREDLNKALPLLKQFMTDYARADTDIVARAEMLYGDLLAQKGEYAEAITHFSRTQELMGSQELGLAAQGRLGEMHFSLWGGGEDTESLKTAASLFNEILNQESLSASLREKTLYRRAKVYEKLGRVESAIKDYMDIVYSYDQSLKAGNVRDWYYFARAGYDAARLFLQNGQERLAARTYERLAASGIPTAAEARQRAADIRTTFKLDN